MAKIKLNAKKLMVFFTIFVLFGSVLGIWVFNTPNKQELAPDGFQVSGYTFYEVQDGTFGAFLPTTTGEQWPIKFRLDPRKAGNITIDQLSTEKIYNSNKIYISYNPNQEGISKVVIAAIEIARVVPLVIGLPITEAYTEDSEPINPNVPLKTCTDASETTAVIVLEVSDSNEVVREGECVIVRGETPDNLILSADKFGMHLVGLKV